MPTPSRHLIYGLVDPQTDELFYIGKTHKRRELRLIEHLECAVQGRDTPVYNYIRRMIFRGVLPKVFVIARIDGTEDPFVHERQWITYFAALAPDAVPFSYAPKTPKSETTLIRAINLQNVIHHSTSSDTCGAGGGLPASGGALRTREIDSALRARSARVDKPPVAPNKGSPRNAP